eukprot:1153934_1
MPSQSSHPPDVQSFPHFFVCLLRKHWPSSEHAYFLQQSVESLHGSSAQSMHLFTDIVKPPTLISLHFPFLQSSSFAHGLKHFDFDFLCSSSIPEAFSDPAFMLKREALHSPII